MSTSRGTPNIKRRKAKNFIYEEAQKRLDELIPQIQDQGINALRVDAHKVVYYSRIKGGHTCSCKVIDTQLQDDEGNIVQALDSSEESFSSSLQSGSEEIKIDFNRPLFGEASESLTADDDIEEIEDFLHREDTDLTGTTGLQDQLFAANAECGICFRTGYVPGFNILNHQRIVLTHYDIEGLDGFTLDRGQPHSLVSLGSDGTASFDLVIPKYWTSIKFSVRDNMEVIIPTITVNDKPFTLQWIKHFSGKKVRLKISGIPVDSKFTHVVLDFETKTEQLVANISQLSKNLDYTMFDTTGNITVYFPMIHSKCESGDLIYVPEKKILLKVTDVTYSQTASNKRLEWQCTTRVVQPQETTYNILRDKSIKF